MDCPAVGRCLISVPHAVVSDDRCDLQPILLKYGGTPHSLCVPVILNASPLRDSFLVAPERERKQFFRCGETLESFYGNESLNFVELWSESGGDVQVCLLPLRMKHNFKDNGDH